MIDDKAIVHKSAKFGENVTIGPFAIIGANVEIGEGTWIGPHAIVKGPTRIGRNNKIYQYSSIGEDPQDKKYDGEPTELVIGDNNVFREFCTINRGTSQGSGVTHIGHDNLFMAYVHIAHDCVVHNHTTFSNNASLAGHVIVEDYVTFGGFSGVHQFCTIGAHSFMSRAMITKDVLPYVIVSGNEATVCGINIVGLKRRGFSIETINNIRRAYKIIFRKGLTSQQALAELEPMVKVCPEIQKMMNALTDTTRGIIR